MKVVVELELEMHAMVNALHSKDLDLY